MLLPRFPNLDLEQRQGDSCEEFVLGSKSKWLRYQSLVFGDEQEEATENQSFSALFKYFGWVFVSLGDQSRFIGSCCFHDV